MNNGNGVSRGDRNRNARLSRLRELVPVTHAIVGIDLADRKQMVVVTDHDSKVLARRTFRCRAWDLGVALDWASERGARAGFAGVTVSCEPTGHRWRVLGQLAADRGLPFVCVQTLKPRGTVRHYSALDLRKRWKDLFLCAVPCDPRALRRYPASISTPSMSDPGLQRAHRSTSSQMTPRSWSSRATARETQTPPNQLG